MFKNTRTKLAAAMTLSLSAGIAHSASVNVVTNGDFETGDLTGWLSFPSPSGTTTVGAPNSPLGAAGSYSALLSADGSGGASFPIIKVERLAEGFLTNGAPVTISFDAYSPLQTVDINAGDNVGKVVFIAEFFTERTGDNGAVNQILFGPPTFLDNGWMHYEYNTNLAADAGGGLSLLFKADCGANVNCRFDAYIDNVSIVTDVSAVPVPAAAWLFGSGLLGLVGVARRKSRS
jgi:hypothetical protein